MATLIQIQDDTWEYLNKLKGKGESFDDVIKKQLMMNPELDLKLDENKLTKKKSVLKSKKGWGRSYGYK